MKTRLRFVLCVGLATVLVAACGSNGSDKASTGDTSQGPKGFWKIGTGGTGGTYYPLGGHLAKLISDDKGYFADVTATAEVTGATIENIRLVQSGDITIGFGESSGTYQAIKGEGVFKKPADDLCSLGILFFSWTQIAVKADSGIKEFKDLEGKRIAVGEPGGSTALLTARIAESLGVKPGKSLPFGLAGMTDAFRDGQIDAGNYLGALKLAALAELDTVTDIYIIGFKGADGEKVQKALPYMVMRDIPAGTYEKQLEPWGPVPVSANTIIVRCDMPEEDAYQATKLMYENLEGFQKTHPAANDMTLKNINANTHVPLNAGAYRYYQEKGIDVAVAIRPKT